MRGEIESEVRYRSPKQRKFFMGGYSVARCLISRDITKLRCTLYENMRSKTMCVLTDFWSPKDNVRTPFIYHLKLFFRIRLKNVHLFLNSQELLRMCMKHEPYFRFFSPFLREFLHRRRSVNDERLTREKGDGLRHRNQLNR